MTEYLHPRKLRRRFGLTHHEGEWLSEAELVGIAQPHQPVSGVYFLIADQRVQYVGQACDVDRRLAEHWRDGKRWEAVTVIECDEKHLDAVESAYIHKFAPPRQGRKADGSLVAPLRETEVYQQRRIVQVARTLKSES